MSEYKITVLGAGGVGKSALVVQFVHNKFVERYDPTIEDSYRKTIDVDGQACQLDILDTAGQEEYTNIQEDYIRNGQGFILVYSITSPNSLADDVKIIRQRILSVRNVKPGDHVPIVLVGNKSDLDSERAVERVEGEEVARQFGCSFFETSAKTKTNITEVFEDIVRQINKTGFNPKAAEEKEAEAARAQAAAAAKEGTTAAAPAAAKPAPVPKKEKKRRCLLL